MATTFTHRRTFGTGFDQVFSAFTDKDSIQALLDAVGGDDAALLSHDADDGRVAYKLRQGVPAQKLPTIVQKLHSGDLMVQRRQTWTRTADGATGETTATVSGVPADINAKSTLKPTGAGCELVVHSTVTVNVPLVGGKIEKAIAGKVDHLLSKEDDFVAASLDDK